MTHRLSETRQRQSNQVMTRRLLSLAGLSRLQPGVVTRPTLGQLFSTTLHHHFSVEHPMIGKYKNAIHYQTSSNDASRCGQRRHWPRAKARGLAGPGRSGLREGGQSSPAGKGNTNKYSVGGTDEAGSGLLCGWWAKGCCAGGGPGAGRARGCWAGGGIWAGGGGGYALRQRWGVREVAANPGQGEEGITAG